MHEKHIVIIGGGLAGLSAGIYARANGYRATVIEHNLALGGVCTAWARGPYMVDGCIHWLTGGPFDRIYEEIGVFPAVNVHTLHHFATYRQVREGIEIPITSDIPAMIEKLCALSPEDAPELHRIREMSHHFADLKFEMDKPQELATIKDAFTMLWELRHDLAAIVHFRKPLGEYCRAHIQDARIAKFFAQIIPEEAATLFLLMMFGYLERGFLSRPAGGTAAFRDAVIATFHRLGAEERLHTTVDEILVKNDRACGVRLSDGTILDADIVISTSSAPETVLRLLGGRYGADDVRRRLETWKLFQPIVMVSFGVAKPFTDTPSTLILSGLEPFNVGDFKNENLYVRIFNDDPSFAPPGHTVVQVMMATDYAWWAKRGTRYRAEKDIIADIALKQLEPYLPGITESVRMVDVATPLTFWNQARSYQGAFEGWIPNADAFFGHINKTLPGLSDFYMAGQWVEPGGGVPTALMSGRQVIQLLCANDGRAFQLPAKA